MEKNDFVPGERSAASGMPTFEGDDLPRITIKLPDRASVVDKVGEDGAEADMPHIRGTIIDEVENGQEYYGDDLDGKKIGEDLKQEDRTARLVYPSAAVHNAISFYREELDKIGKHLFSEMPFYGAIYDQSTVYFSEQISTACAFYHVKADTFCICINPHLFRYYIEHRMYNEILGIVCHEILHLAWLHVTKDIVSTSPRQQTLQNIAADLAIDSFIENYHSLISGSPQGARKLPVGVCMPTQPWGKLAGLPEPTSEQLEFAQKIREIKDRLAGVDPTKKKEQKSPSAQQKQIEAQQKLSAALSDLFVQMPHNQATEWYLAILNDWLQNNPEHEEALDDAPADFTGDSHILWENLPDDVKNYIERKVGGILERAVRTADSNSSGWGNFPEHMKILIRDAVSGAVPWKELLAQFLGRLNPGQRHSTIKKISRKQPYILPGHRRGRTARILIAQDQSGSVSDEMTAQIFGALDELRKVSHRFDWVAFDADVVESSLKEIKKGSTLEWVREATGGTNFQAVLDWATAPERKGTWEAIVFCTDGECSRPHNESGIPIAWILPPGCNLHWGDESQDLVIKMENSYKKGSGIF